jgi:hypothetical protein
VVGSTAVRYKDPGGHSRWRRLRPRDGGDAAWLILAGLGLLFMLASGLGLDGSELGAVIAGFILGPILAVHGSTPVFFFLGLAAYLVRGGRTIGNDRVWIWTGFVLTIPLWFLAGQPITGRRGSLTWLIVLWNLVAVTVMLIGVHRTLRER